MRPFQQGRRDVGSQGRHQPTVGGSDQASFGDATEVWLALAQGGKLPLGRRHFSLPSTPAVRRMADEGRAVIDRMALARLEVTATLYHLGGHAVGIAVDRRVAL